MDLTRETVILDRISQVANETFFIRPEKMGSGRISLAMGCRSFRIALASQRSTRGPILTTHASGRYL